MTLVVHALVLINIDSDMHDDEIKDYQLFTVMLWSAVHAAGVLFILILEFSERNMPQFLDDVHIVEALNDPVDDPGSKEAKLFVNMGNVLGADFFFPPCTFSLC